MKKRILAILIVLLILAVLIGGSLHWMNSQFAQAQVQVDIPRVFITAPPSAQLPYAESHVPITISAISHSPLVRMELWLDGELQATQDVTYSADTLSDTKIIDVIVPAGSHMLLGHATNRAGLIGQSQPLALALEPKPHPGDRIIVTVPAEPGQTLADVASANHTDVPTLQQLNPGLPTGTLPTNSSVVVQTTAKDDGQTIPPPNATNPNPNPNPVPPKAPVTIPDVPPLKPIDPTVLNVTPLEPLQIIGLWMNLKPPAAPSNLQGEVNNCQVRLSWNDNANNESRYDLWIWSINVPARVIASFEPAGGSAAWVEFPAPQTGLVTFWVDAVNPLGSQSSNPVTLTIDSACPASLASQLTVDLIDLSESGNADRVYCYVSYEGAPEFRMPLDISQFVAMSGKVGTFPQGAVPTLPFPADGKLNLSGECWGWTGNKLAKIGNSIGEFASDMWNGQIQTLNGEGYTIHLTIAPLGALKLTPTQGVNYDFIDNLIPAPTNVHDDTVRCAFGPGCGAGDRELLWDWNPLPNSNKKLTGFKVYLNGQPFADVVGGDKRSVFVTLPASCDMHVKWQVVAVAGSGTSLPSLPYEYDLIPCQAYVSARFESVDFHWTHDGAGSGGPGDCDELDGYGTLSLNADSQGIAKNLPGSNGGTFHIFCRALSVAGMAPGMFFGNLGFLLNGYSKFDPYPDTLVLAIPNEGNFTLEARDRFWDHDTWSSDDPVADNDLILQDISYKSALQDWGCGKTFYVGQPYRSDWEGQATAHVTLRVYPGPQVCGMANPPKLPMPDGSPGYFQPRNAGWAPESGDSTMENLLELAREDLAARLGVPPESFSVTKASKITWGNGSLGCSNGGRTEQVLIPGYLIGLRDKNGKEYEYHTTMRQVQYCPYYYEPQE